MIEQDRILCLDGIHNFRDYGGYRADGGPIRRGLLWRSGQHTDASREDLERVHALGIATVIDLRGDSERRRHPCLRHGAFDGEVVFYPGETAGLKGQAVHEEAARQIVTAADAHAAMVRLYKTLAWRPVLAGTFQLYFEALADRNGASLLHCLAGKDRTGVAVALLHSLLGVHDDDIMADYLLTNVAGDPERRIEAGAKHMRSRPGNTMEEAAIRTVMSVHPEFLDTAMGAIRERHGTVAGYAEEVLGVSAQRLARLREQLVE